ncbi:Actin- protein 2/3 complex subunit 5 [Phlyctochytrium bullatum]|nr:Actin- protein 2/3 complex subunit 5 [Phlyctochytrium bullatum]
MEDDFENDDFIPQYSSVPVAELESALQSRSQDVRSYLARFVLIPPSILPGSGAYSEAVRRSLENPPLGRDIQGIKDKNLAVVMEAVSSVKATDISNVVKTLNSAELDVLLKFIYRGFASPDLFNATVLLAWHEKVVEAGGVGSIMRVLTDRVF